MNEGQRQAILGLVSGLALSQEEIIALLIKAQVFSRQDAITHFETAMERHVDEQGSLQQVMPLRIILALLKRDKAPVLH